MIHPIEEQACPLYGVARHADRDDLATAIAGDLVLVHVPRQQDEVFVRRVTFPGEMLAHLHRPADEGWLIDSATIVVAQLRMAAELTNHCLQAHV
ncbi:hypothetical protein IFT82_16400 [Sphingomonas sp. CFBP 8760]|nr:hypothetical protein [Sphingomonas sp. CFBP 8760]